MRRTIFAAALLAAASAYGIKTDIRPVRVALLAPADSYADHRDAQASDLIRDQLAAELHERGYEVDVVRERLGDLARDENSSIDYYIDVFGPGGGGHTVAGVGIPVAGNAVVDLAVIVNHVAATVNVYDGRTLELVRTLDLHRKTTSVAPSAIGIGGRAFWGVVAVPLVEWAQYRSGIRTVAHDAARQIDGVLRR